MNFCSFELIPKYSHNIPIESRTLSCARKWMHVQAGAGGANRSTLSLHTSPHTRCKKNPPPRQIGKTFSSSAIIRQFSPTCDPCTPRSIIDPDHRPDQRLRPMEIPCRAISSPREKRWLSLSLSLSLSTSRGGGSRFEPRVRAAGRSPLFPPPPPPPGLTT